MSTPIIPAHDQTLTYHESAPYKAGNTTARIERDDEGKSISSPKGFEVVASLCIPSDRGHRSPNVTLYLRRK